MSYNHDQEVGPVQTPFELLAKLEHTIKLRLYTCASHSELRLSVNSTFYFNRLRLSVSPKSLQQLQLQISTSCVSLSAQLEIKLQNSISCASPSAQFNTLQNLQAKFQSAAPLRQLNSIKTPSQFGRPRLRKYAGGSGTTTFQLAV